MRKGERVARFTVILVALGLPLAAVAAIALLGHGGAVELHARMPEQGGWGPDELTVGVGEPLRLRLTSDDVVHGFAVGKLDFEPIDLNPGRVTEVTLTFDEPGRYTYYCTRWCGPDHWRMRGVIEVTGPREEYAETPSTPLFIQLGLDIDAPHPAEHVPERRPSAERGARLSMTPAQEVLGSDPFKRRSPAEVWETLRSDSITGELSDMQVWDLMASLWARSTTPEMLAEGRRLYRTNCAGCHGESGAGDGVMAASLARPVPADPRSEIAAADSMVGFGHRTESPADFTHPGSMLGASSALLEGKIIRGGMGTGMPYWGPIFTERQIRALVDYLWSFQFDLADSAASDANESPAQ